MYEDYSWYNSFVPERESRKDDGELKHRRRESLLKQSNVSLPKFNHRESIDKDLRETIKLQNWLILSLRYLEKIPASKHHLKLPWLEGPNRTATSMKLRLGILERRRKRKLKIP
jgi:hypothetical protein